MTKQEAQKFLDEANGRQVLVYDGLCTYPYGGAQGYPKIESKPDYRGFERECIQVGPFCSIRLDNARLEYGYMANQQNVKFGSDPEFFFLKDDKVVPGVQAAQGLQLVAPDGFQSELHPAPNTCRQLAANRLGACIDEAFSRAQAHNFQIDFSVGREIDDMTFLSVPEEDRRFGCQPTKTPYKKVKVPIGTRTRFRSCGGHIHLGEHKLASLKEADQHKLVQLLDIICGNTCVLIDRDPANIRRRKTYGRAGEYRMKSYGIEYRVPSNFWLKGYVLWSMVSGLCRNASNIFLYAPNLADIILKEIDIKKVRKAINNNDQDLALEIFDQYCSIIDKHNVILNGGVTPDNYSSARDFLLDPQAIQKASCSLTQWFDYDWTEEEGFEDFLDYNY